MKPTRPCVLLVTLLPTILLLLFMSTTSTPADAGSPPLMGGWSPIKDIKDPYVRQIAEFAVTEHNKLLQRHGDKKHLLALRKVVRGETQVVAGTNYRLVVEAKYAAGGRAAATGQYEVVVWDKPWEKLRQLTSFKPVKD